LDAIVCQHLTVARVAEALAVSWDTANDAVLAEGWRVLIGDPNRLDGVAVIGVDEHCWRHTRRGEKYVTVIIDLTPVRDGAGPARLLDMVDGRSKIVFKTWLDRQSTTFRAGIDVVAMDGFTGFKTAAAETVPDAAAVMDPFHVVALAGDALERCGNASSNKHADTVAAPATRSTASAACCAPAPTCSPIGNANG
jgi:transposase